MPNARSDAPAKRSRRNPDAERGNELRCMGSHRPLNEGAAAAGFGGAVITRWTPIAAIRSQHSGTGAFSREVRVHAARGFTPDDRDDRPEW